MERTDVSGGGAVSRSARAEAWWKWRRMAGEEEREECDEEEPDILLAIVGRGG